MDDDDNSVDEPDWDIKIFPIPLIPIEGVLRRHRNSKSLLTPTEILDLAPFFGTGRAGSSADFENLSGTHVVLPSYLSENGCGKESRKLLTRTFRIAAATAGYQITSRGWDTSGTRLRFFCSNGTTYGVPHKEDGNKKERKKIRPLDATQKCRCQFTVIWEDDSWKLKPGNGLRTHSHHPRLDTMAFVEKKPGRFPPDDYKMVDLFYRSFVKARRFEDAETEEGPPLPPKDLLLPYKNTVPERETETTNANDTTEVSTHEPEEVEITEEVENDTTERDDSSTETASELETDTNNNFDESPLEPAINQELLAGEDNDKPLQESQEDNQVLFNSLKTEWENDPTKRDAQAATVGMMKECWDAASVDPDAYATVVTHVTKMHEAILSLNLKPRETTVRTTEAAIALTHLGSDLIEHSLPPKKRKRRPYNI